jgi:hypothetical protein
MFERVVEACIAAGLVGGEGFAVDASLIQADASKTQNRRFYTIVRDATGSSKARYKHLQQMVQGKFLPALSFAATKRFRWSGGAEPTSERRHFFHEYRTFAYPLNNCLPH